jgi:hypothetical protein
MPERWLKENHAFESDKREGLQPFYYGTALALENSE